MPVISFVSEKGGVGKTTSCYHTAVGLSRFHSKRVLMVDADYQRGGLTGRLFPKLIEQKIPSNTTTLFHKFQQLYSATAVTPVVDIMQWSNGQTSIDLIPFDPRLSSVSEDKLPSTNNIRENNKLLFDHLRVIDDVIKHVADEYDFVLIDSHPEVSDVLRSVIFASDYCVSPVKLDKQSSVGVATIIGEINNVNADVEMLKSVVDASNYNDTEFKGSIGMMAREWGGSLKWSEQVEYNRLRRTGGVFNNYVTEGDGLRQAAASRIPVFDVSIANAIKQSEQFKAVTQELIARCP